MNIVRLMSHKNDEWYTTYHREALENDDLKLVRHLYEARLKDLDEYIGFLESIVAAVGEKIEIKFEPEKLWKGGRNE